MNRNICLTRIFILLLTAAPLATAQVHNDKKPQADNGSKLQSYVEQVAELSSRARANVYFPNAQSIFQGVQVNFVNVGAGNLTFSRRDMVASGRIPLVLARVYDSASAGSTDFGPGWILSAAETVTVSDHIARLSSENGSVIEFVEKSPNKFLLKRDHPSDYLQLLQSAPDVVQAHLRSGVVKEYRQIGSLYRLATVTDRDGNQIRLTYSSGTISRLENGNHFLRFTRNEKGRIIAAQDDQGRNIQYLYDEKDVLVAVDDLGANRWRYTYSSDGRLKRAIDPLQRANFSVEYEGAGRVRRLRLPSGVIHYSYDNATHLTTVRDRKELISRYFQNDEGITTRVVNALGEETSIVLDADRNVASLWRNGAVFETMEYDQQHRVASRHNLSGSGATDFHYRYDPQTGLLSRIQGSDGTSRIFSYDSAGRLIGADLPDGDHSYTYSSSGDLSGFSADNVNVSFSSDSDGLITSMNEGKGRITRMSYRAGGELAQTTFSDGETATYEYQPMGLRLKSAYQDGRRVQYSYDPAGNLTGTKVFDATSKQTAGQTLTMDDSYQLVRWTLFDGTEHTFQYDPNGNLTEWKQGKSVTRFEYDELNRIAAVITPDGQRLTYTYKPGEHSLIEQYDHASIAIADLRDTGSTFAPQSAVMDTRPLPAALGSVRFSETLGTFQLANSDGTEIVTPDGVIEQPLQRMRLVAGGTPLRARQAEFSRPFNTLFMPAEYASINCCPLCTINGYCPPGCDNGLGGNDITAITPSQAGIEASPVEVDISGAFTGGTTTVTVKPQSGTSGSIMATPSSNNGSDIIASFNLSSAGVGKYNVSMKDSGGPSDNSVTFTVLPSLDPLDPPMGLVGAGTPVTLSGAGFTSSTGINAGPNIVVSQISFVSSTQMTAIFTPTNSTAGGGSQTVNITVNGQTSNSQSFYGQIPSAIQELSAGVSTKQSTANGCPPSNQGAEGPFGMKLAVAYQVLDQQASPKAISATMPVREDLTNFVVDGQPIDETVLNGFVTPSGNTNADGTFTDDPIGACAQAPFTNATFTQRLFVPLSSQLSPTVRTNNYSQTGEQGCGSMGNGADVNVSVQCH